MNRLRFGSSAPSQAPDLGQRTLVPPQYSPLVSQVPASIDTNPEVEAPGEALQETTAAVARGPVAVAPGRPPLGLSVAATDVARTLDPKFQEPVPPVMPKQDDPRGPFNVVWRVQGTTFAIARAKVGISLGPNQGLALRSDSPSPLATFRAKPGHRTPEAQALRDQVAGAIRQQRAQAVANLIPQAKRALQTETIQDALKRSAAFVEEAKTSSERAFNDDDPNSPTYRWRDTGHIAGSRKEEAVGMIRAAARDGRAVRATEIDWEAVEQNPRTAKELITKANLFGDTDWEAMRERGVNPGAAYLISKVYAAIGKEPGEDTPRARQDYATALNTLRDRLEPKAEVDGVLSVLDEIAEELKGGQMSAEQAETYKGLRETYREAATVWRAVEARRDAAYKAHMHLKGELYKVQHEQDKRLRRKWKPDPEIDAQVVELTARVKESEAVWTATLEVEKHVKVPRGGGFDFETSKHPDDIAKDKAYRAMDTFVQECRRGNILSSPVTRGWLMMGESFFRVVNYHSYKGSEAFAQHAVTARAGKITDWAWAESRKGPKVVTRGEAGFKLLTADSFERKGGRSVVIEGSIHLKTSYGLRDVQSGKWVLDEPESAKWHITACAEAFADLSDFLGITDDAISMEGRLAMAFGARGHGMRTGAAHYEPIERVINLTKMAGGGCLAHEWFHALDNMAQEIVTGTAGSATHYGTEDLGIPGPVGEAFKLLAQAMSEGTHRWWEDMPYTEAQERDAVRNVDGYPPGRSSTRDAIRTAPDAAVARDRLAALFAAKNFGDPEKKKSQTLYNQWLDTSAIYHGRNPERVAKKPLGGPRSKYALEAIRLDRGHIGKYWSRSYEMAARAFAQWVEKRIKDQGDQSDYLAAMNDNRYYALFNEKPFPEGEEQTRIEAAFERLFAALKQEKVLKAKE